MKPFRWYSIRRPAEDAPARVADLPRPQEERFADWQVAAAAARWIA